MNLTPKQTKGLLLRLRRRIHYAMRENYLDGSKDEERGAVAVRRTFKLVDFIEREFKNAVS